MSKSIYSIKSEISGQAYRRLIDIATVYCNSFLLVVQKMRFNERGQNILATLQPSLIKVEESSSWPGTKMTKRSAAVYYYNLNDLTAFHLKNHADRLYAWRQPDLPEDLCFLREGNEPWLITISHENDAYFLLDAHEYHLLIEKIPELDLSMDE
jgi:hypothetical protein